MPGFVRSIPMARALDPSTLVATKVGEIRRVVCGSPDYFAALLTNGFELQSFVEPVLSRRRKGWPADNYRIPRAIIFAARKKP